MHETAVAQNILETVLSHAEKLGKKPVCVRISCGQFNALNDEAMQFAFEIATKGTVAEGTRLQIVHKPIQAICAECGNSFDFDLYSAWCLKCRSEEFRFGEDAPLLLEQIEFEDDD